MSFSNQLKQDALEIWERGFHHPFVQEVGKGILPKKTFQFYLLQDYVYLMEYAKVFALGAMKSTSEQQLAYFVEAQYGILKTELDLHRQYMHEFGIQKKEMENVHPSLFNRTYTANMLAVGQTGGHAEIISTILPCAWTYYDYACRLKELYASTLEKNPYRSWIDMYADPAFLKSFEWMFDSLDELIQTKGEIEKQKIKQIFIASVDFEYLFWEMSYHQEMSLVKSS